MKHLLILVTLVLLSTPILFSQSIPDDVTIRRTAYGVPHILADNLKSVAFGLAYAECEDRGEKVIEPLIRARGVYAKFTSDEYADMDMYAKLTNH